MLQCNVFDDFERRLWVGEPTIEMNCPSAALSATRTFDDFSRTAAAGESRRSGWKFQIDGFERLLNAIQQTLTKIQRRSAPSPLYQMPYRSILRVQQNHPVMDGPNQTLVKVRVPWCSFPKAAVCRHSLRAQVWLEFGERNTDNECCLLYTSPSPRDL